MHMWMMYIWINVSPQRMFRTAFHVSSNFDLFLLGRYLQTQKTKKTHEPKFIPGRLKFTMLNGIICELKHLHPELLLFSEFEGSMHVTLRSLVGSCLGSLSTWGRNAVVSIEVQDLRCYMCYAVILMICKCLQYILFAMFCFSHHSGQFWRFCTIIGFSNCLIRCLSFPAEVAPTCFCSWIIWMVPTFISHWHVHLYIPFMFVACFWNYAGTRINEIGTATCYIFPGYGCPSWLEVLSE